MIARIASVLQPSSSAEDTALPVPEILSFDGIGIGIRLSERAQLFWLFGCGDQLAGSVSTSASWRIPVVMGYAAARFRGMKRMRCPACRSTAVRHRSERTAQGYRRFRCGNCGKQFNERSAGLLNRAQYPSDVIALRGALAASLQAQPTGSGRNVPDPRARLLTESEH